MEIEFENPIGRLIFFVPSTEHQSCLDKSLHGKFEINAYTLTFIKLANWTNRRFKTSLVNKASG